MSANILLGLLLVSIFLPTHSPEMPPTLIVGADSELIEDTRTAALMWEETGVVRLTIVEGCHSQNDVNVCKADTWAPEGVVASYSPEQRQVNVFDMNNVNEFFLCHEIGHVFGLHHRSDYESCMSTPNVPNEGPDAIDVEMLLNPSVTLATNYHVDVCSGTLTNPWNCRTIPLVDSEWMPEEGVPWWQQEGGIE